MKRPSRPQRLNRVLCMRLDNMGDILMTGPAMRAIRETHPDASITLLTSHLGSLIAPYVPEINEVIAWDSPWVRTYGQAPEPESVEEMARLLKMQEYDAAFIFTVYTQSPLPSALLAYLAGIPIRAAHCHENPYHLLTHWIPDPEPKRLIRHEVERQLALVKALGCETTDQHLALRIPSAAFQTVRRKLNRRGVDVQRGWILMHPGCTEGRRRYRTDGFIAAARQLRVHHELPIVITGSGAERPLAENAAARIGKGAISLAGQTNLGELCALISLSPLLVTNNTVAVHIAAATGTPVVDIYARTNPQHTPWMVPSRVLYFDVPCRDCERGTCDRASHQPMRSVSPREIVRAAGELLAESAPAASIRRISTVGPPNPEKLDIERRSL